MSQYARDLTPDLAGFACMWRYVGAHLATYGHPPEYRKTAQLLAAGGFMSTARGG